MFIKSFGRGGGRKSFLLLLPLLLLFLLLLLLLLLFSVTWHGSRNQEFINSCGDILNISFPFQLLGDPSNTCNDTYYTLICDENNRTLLNLFIGTYVVQSINYTDYSISLLVNQLNQAINQTNSSLLCISEGEFPIALTVDFDPVNAGGGPYNLPALTMVATLGCENPVHTPIYLNKTPVHTPIYLNKTGYCQQNFGNGNYSYVVAGDQLRARDIADSCSVEALYLSSSQLIRERGSNMSLSDMNRELGYGVEVSWESVRACERCRKRAFCFGSAVNVISVCGDACKFVPYFQIGKLWTQTHRGWWTQIKDNRFFLLLTIGVILSARLLFAPCVYGFLIYKFSRRHLSTFDSIEGFLRSQNRLVVIRYSYSNIKRMTNGFRDKLGEGGYGSVYKGKLRSGPLVAVKMLSKPKANGQDFINEVATIGRIHHINVVELIGYCAERSKRALVYDFMPNGSLEKHICSPEGKLSLSCKKMYEISLGVTRGVGYLHQGCDMQILHFDIKPHNILLDENFTPKVSDFGLAKLYPTNDSIVTVTVARGTLGYMAPELFYKNIGGVSYKSDIYSFGMLLMEMAGRRRNWNSSADSSQFFFPSWVYDQFAEGKNIQIGEATEEENEMVKKMMLVALWCIQMKPCDRPSMNKVIEMLEGSIELLPMPPKPFLFSQGRQPEDNGMNKRLSNLSGACMDSLTYDISGR